MLHTSGEQCHGTPPTTLHAPACEGRGPWAPSSLIPGRPGLRSELAPPGEPSAGPPDVGLDPDHERAGKEAADVDKGVEPVVEAWDEGQLLGVALVKLVGAKHGDAGLDAARADGDQILGEAGTEVWSRGLSAQGPLRPASQLNLPWLRSSHQPLLPQRPP